MSSNAYKKTHSLGLLILAVAAISISPTCANAQPNLNFKRITVNWPTIELYYSVACNGNPEYGMKKSNFRISEDGVPVDNFTMWCPDPTVRCALSIALVFDGSMSMSGSGKAGAMQAGHAFVDLMDGVLDEAAILWFTHDVTIFQAMTTIKPLLHSAVDQLPSSSGTALWDGCYTGIIELINNGVNPCRAVIVMTDGEDNSSDRTPAEVISLANRNRIRVFTIGLGSRINATELETISLLTGGKYYQTPNAGQLAAIYHEITTIIFQGFQECVLTYDRSCADGGLRTVSLELNGVCNGSDTKQRTYRAPVDTTTFMTLQLGLGHVRAAGGTTIHLPLELRSTLYNANLYPLSFTLLYDSTQLDLTGVSTPSRTLLESVSTQVDHLLPISGKAAARISTLDPALIDSSGTLLYMDFDVHDTQDTVRSQLEVMDVTISQGCYQLDIEGREISIVPPSPSVTFSLDWPKALHWVDSLGDYSPNPFTVEGRFFNTGEREAVNGQYTLTTNLADLKLVSPMTYTQPGNPPNLQPDSMQTVAWRIAALPRTYGDTLRVCMESRYDNHPSMDGCAKIYIPPAANDFECSIDVPKIDVAPDSTGYAPNPFPVRVEVINNGSGESGRLTAEILLPNGLQLTGTPEQMLRTREMTPATLSPGSTAVLEWFVEAEVFGHETSRTINVAFYEETNNIGYAETVVDLPAIAIPFYFTLEADGPTEFCEGESVRITAPEGYGTYYWTGPKWERSRTITVHHSGSYACRVEAASGHPGYSDTIIVVVHPLPTPVISRGGDVLSTGDVGNYKWYHDGQLIPGARGQALVVTANGSYQVEVTDVFGCVGMSAVFDVTVLDIGATAHPNEFFIEVYPNPATQRATIQIRAPQNESATVWLMDMLGRKQKLTDLSRGIGHYSTTLDLTEIPAGLYHIIVYSAAGVHAKKFMKQ